MSRNRTDSIMKDSTMKKNQDFIMNTSHRKTDSTMTDFTTMDSTITTKWNRKTDFTMMPKKDSTMMAINKITKNNNRYNRTNRKRKTSMRRNKLFIIHTGEKYIAIPKILYL